MSHILKTAISRIFRNSNGIRTPFYSYALQSSSLEATRQQPQDLVMQTLRASKSASDLLSSVAQHLQVMNHKHVLQVLRSLFDLQKLKRLDDNVQDIVENPTFAAVCQALKRNARVLETNECIEALKILSYLKIPADSVIQQTMLQLVRTNINEFNVRQIMFIDFVISKFDNSNPLVDALKLALPLVFQIHLPLELDQEDLPQLNEMMWYACSHALPDRCINNIVTGILLHEDNIDSKTARNIVWSLTMINVNPQLHPARVNLLDICFEVLAQSVHRMSIDEVLKLSVKLRARIAEKHYEFYNEKLFEAFANYVIENSLNFDMSLDIGKNLFKVGHINIELADHICRKADENLEAVSSSNPHTTFNFISCLSSANFVPKPDQWKRIKKHILKSSLFEMTKTNLPYTKMFLELSSLGVYDLNSLQKFFSKDVLSNYLDREDYLLDYMGIVVLHEAAKLYCEGYDLSPPEKILKKAYECYSVFPGTPALEGSLAAGLGGEEFYATNVQLPNGIVSDHIVVLQNGRPVPLQKPKTEGKINLHQLKIPQSAVVVCIVKFNRLCYSLNSKVLRGNFRLTVDVLEGNGYPTVPININAWMSLPDWERTPYLMRELDMHCQDAGHTLFLKTT